MTDAPTGPVRTGERYDAMDVLRGFALCGILLMNILWMGTSWTRNVPDLPISASDPDWRVWFVEQVLFEGTMRGLFTLLFGAACLIIAARPDRGAGGPPAADVWFRRCLMLLGLGLVNYTLLLWPGDILWIYGWAGMLIYVFRHAAPRKLAVLAVVILACVSFGEGYSSLAEVEPYRAGLEAHEAQVRGEALSEAQTEALEAWKAHQAFLSPAPEAFAEETGRRMGGYASAIGWSFDTYADWGLSGWGVLSILESAAFMLIGMALFRWRVLTGERSLRFYVAMMLVGYGVGLPINLAEHLTQWRTAFSPEAWWPNFTYEASRLPTTMGHLGLVLTLWKARAWFFLEPGLRAIGRMALTNYLMQSLIAAVVFIALGWFNRLNWAELWLVCVGVWIFQAIFSLLWLRGFALGPAEWVLRAVVQGRRPPLRRAAAVP